MSNKLLRGCDQTGSPARWEMWSKGSRLGISFPTLETTFVRIIVRITLFRKVTCGRVACPGSKPGNVKSKLNKDDLVFLFPYWKFQICEVGSCFDFPQINIKDAYSEHFDFDHGGDGGGRSRRWW